MGTLEKQACCILFSVCGTVNIYTSTQVEYLGTTFWVGRTWISPFLFQFQFLKNYLYVWKVNSHSHQIFTLLRRTVTTKTWPPWQNFESSAPPPTSINHQIMLTLFPFFLVNYNLAFTNLIFGLEPSRFAQDNRPSFLCIFI